jgi:glycosyltransferase involved in cell wall biosynthesis
MTPIVSICMPHLNSRPFTEERMETILQQSFQDWELVIIDSDSRDGSREILQHYADADSRIRLTAAPRDGIYSNLNRALALGAGKYVYVATSDDTMSPDCLTRMVEALERNLDCGLCHCCLEIIDQNGRPVGPEFAWENYVQQKYFGAWTGIPHVRRAPHDGLLHFGFFTVYTSLTQLLIRRSVFDRLGLFRTDCSSHADFEWGMRVGLSENVVHVPQKLATWRQHGQQATQPASLLQARARGDFHRLTQKAIAALETTDARLAGVLRRSALHRYYLVDELKARRALSHSLLGRLSGTIGFVFKYPRFSLLWLFRKMVRRRKIIGEFGELVRNEFANLGLTGLLVRLD